MLPNSVTIPDCISTLDLSKLWMQKALQDLELSIQSVQTGCEDEDEDGETQSSES